MITFKVLLLLLTIISILLNFHEFFKNGFKSKEQQLEIYEKAIAETDNAGVKRGGVTFIMLIMLGLSIVFQLIYIVMACSFITNIFFVLFSLILFLTKIIRSYRSITSIFDIKKMAMVLPGRFGNIVIHGLNVLYPVIVFIILVILW